MMSRLKEATTEHLFPLRNVSPVNLKETRAAFHQKGRLETLCFRGRRKRTHLGRLELWVISYPEKRRKQTELKAELRESMRVIVRIARIRNKPRVAIKGRTLELQY